MLARGRQTRRFRGTTPPLLCLMRPGIRESFVLEIFVDADACPVKAEIERVAGRHDLTVHMVSNGGLRPSAHPRFRHVIVTEGADAADN